MVYQYSENFIFTAFTMKLYMVNVHYSVKCPEMRQKFANLRAYYGYMWGYPGKNYFMGNEFAQGREWNYQESLIGIFLMKFMVVAGIKLYRIMLEILIIFIKNAPLFELDTIHKVLNGLLLMIIKNSVFVFERRSKKDERIIVISTSPLFYVELMFGVNIAGEYMKF